MPNFCSWAARKPGHTSWISQVQSTGVSSVFLRAEKNQSVHLMIFDTVEEIWSTKSLEFSRYRKTVS